MKKCTICRKKKAYSDYYMCLDSNYNVYRYKSECKRCTLRRKTTTSRKKIRDKLWARNPKKQAYQKEYMKRNADKIKVYKARFNAKNPHYFRDYMRKKRKEIAESKYAMNERDIA